MSWSRPTLSELIARTQADINGRLPGAASALRRSVLNVLSRVFSGGLNGLYGRLDVVANFLPDTTDAVRVARWGAIFGLTRKSAIAATGTATLAGTNGVTVLAGAILVRIDGARYVTTAAVTIAGGTAAAPIAAEGAGVAGAVDAGQQLTFLSPVVGVQAIAVVAGGGVVGGAEEEDIEAFRQRLLLRIRNPVRGGSRSDYVIWAREVAEVTRAWVYENWNGLGTVKLLFVCDGRDNIIPLAGDISRVAAYVEDRRPITAQVTVAAPIADALNLTIALTPGSSDVRAAVTDELRDLISREAEPGGTILISHINEAISLAAGETDHVLTSPTGNVTAAAGHISVLGTITWS